MANFHLETYGCRMNQADSDLIRGILSQDFQEASADEADFIIINTCGVVAKTERKILKRISYLQSNGKKIVLAGCLPIISPEVKRLVSGAIGPNDILKIREVAANIIKGRRVFLLSEKKIDKARFYSLKDRDNTSLATAVAISEGCSGKCSYCATRLARGRLKSFSEQAIVKEITRAAEKGFKEIHLTAQDTASYGLDRGELALPSLLEKISLIAGDFKVRLGMANPAFVKEMTSRLISIMQKEKIYNFIHLPVQSGSDRILKKMKRQYLSSEAVKTAALFTASFSDCLIALDIIVGFPGESEDDFDQTLNMIKKIQPHIVHINKYSLRPGTEAAAMPQLPSKTISRRSGILARFCDMEKMKINQKFLNKKLNVVITKKGKRDTLIARPQSFRAVILKEGKLGAKKQVKIVGARPNYLIGE